MQSAYVRAFDRPTTLQLKNKLASESLPGRTEKLVSSGCSHFFLEFIKGGAHRAELEDLSVFWVLKISNRLFRGAGGRKSGGMLIPVFLHLQPLWQAA